MSSFRIGRWLLGLVATVASASLAIAQPYTFNPSNVVVLRVGGTDSFGPGASALSNAATSIFLDQFLPSTAGQLAPQDTAGVGLSLALPTVAGTSGNPLAVTVSGTATSEGYLTRSADGLSLIVGGYNANVGTASVASSSPATIARTIGVITPTSINTSNAFNDGGSINIRGVASPDGSSLYGVAGGGTGSIRNITNTGTISASTAIVTQNIRNLSIFGNSLFYSTSSGTAANNGIFLAGSVGTLPTSAVTGMQLPGLGTSGTGTPSAYSFFLLDNPLNSNNWNSTGLDTLYIADDRTTANGGGVQRWVYDGTNFVLDATMPITTTGGNGGARGLAASFDAGTNSVTVWATSASGTSSLVSFTDQLTATSGAFSTLLTLATAPTNTAFRGVALAPVPEPATILGIAAGTFGAAGLVRRRFRKSIEG